MCSSPTRVMSADVSPSRAVPQAILVGRAARCISRNSPWSSSRPPTCAPLRSTPAAPYRMTSSGFFMAQPDDPPRPCTAAFPLRRDMTAASASASAMSPSWPVVGTAAPDVTDATKAAISFHTQSHSVA